MSANTSPFDVALSFAGEDRSTAARLADLLSERGVRVFYDRYDAADLWGKDLHEHFSSIYSGSRFVVLLVSHAYAAKSWTRFEAQAAIARALHEVGSKVLPVALDDAIIQLPLTMGYVDLRETPIEQVADMIVAKLGEGATPPARATLSRVHVIPSEGKWAVKPSGSASATQVYSSKASAIAAAREIAKGKNGELVVHRRDGLIESRERPQRGH